MERGSPFGKTENWKGPGIRKRSPKNTFQRLSLQTAGAKPPINVNKQLLRL